MYMINWTVVEMDVYLLGKTAFHVAGCNITKNTKVREYMYILGVCSCCVFFTKVI